MEFPTPQSIVTVFIYDESCIEFSCNNFFFLLVQFFIFEIIPERLNTWRAVETERKEEKWNE